MQTFFSLTDLDLKGKRVIVRVDFNVPLDKEGNITDGKRIKESLPTIKFILKNKAKQLILMSHLGRPDGKVVESLRMGNVAKELEKLLKKPVKKLDNCIDIQIPDDKIIILENLRFHPEEEKNDEAFAKKLASIADIFVNDAFGTCHRAHASVEAITRFLPSAAGFLLQKEIEVMGKAMESPARPFIAILGGAKVSDKINVINNLLNKVDALLIGGAMMFTFYKSMGIEVGKSKVEDDKLSLAKELLEKSNNKIMLPTDTIVADKIDNEAITKKVKIKKIPADMIGLDIGPETIKIYKEIIAEAKTIIWNGPMGVFEIEKFAKGTKNIAKAMAKNREAVTIVGGGDSAAAIDKLRLGKKLTHVSTGGGASLEFLEGKTLPAIVALEENYKKRKN